MPKKTKEEAEWVGDEAPAAGEITSSITDTVSIMLIEQESLPPDSTDKNTIFTLTCLLSSPYIWSLTTSTLLLIYSIL